MKGGSGGGKELAYGKASNFKTCGPETKRGIEHEILLKVGQGA